MTRKLIAPYEAVKGVKHGRVDDLDWALLELGVEICKRKKRQRGEIDSNIAREDDWISG